MYRPFRFWCNKILPLVYDDSLSYYELLCKLVEYVGTLTQGINANTNAINNIQSMLNDFFGSPEFEQTISDKLDEMAEDGTLNEMLMQITKMAKFVPTDAEHEQYVSGIASVVASWFAHILPQYTTCVVGNRQNVSTPFVPTYCDVYTVIYANLMQYDAIIDDIYTFGKWETENWHPSHTDKYDYVTIGGVNYPLLYSNCSGFLTMLTKGRDYPSSPYYKLFTDATANGRALAYCCLEKGDSASHPWTYDFMNVLLTWRMAENMKASGCSPKKIVSKTSEGVSYELDMQYMRDGDVFFTGNEASYPTRYHGINHCSLYFKTLDALNAAGAAYGVTFQPYDDGDISKGFIVHCSGSTDGQSYGHMNVLRVETFAHYVNNLSVGSCVYGSQIANNAMNSSKQFMNVSGKLVLYNCEIYNGNRGGAGDARLEITALTAFTTGRTGNTVMEGNNGIISYGQYRYRQAYDWLHNNDTLDLDNYIGPAASGQYLSYANSVTIENGPTAGYTTDADIVLLNPTSARFILEVTDIVGEAGWTIQKITTLSTNPHSWERSVNYDGQSSLWQVLY